MKKANKVFEVFLAALPIIIIMGIVFSFVAFDRITLDTIDNTMVTGKENSLRGHGKHIHNVKLVYSDKETFMVGDSWAWFIFNSSDTYGLIKKGHKYKFTVCGWRIPFFSKYRNILSFEEKDLTSNIEK